MKIRILAGIFLLYTFNLSAQNAGNGIIEGRIFNALNNEPVPFANIIIWGTNIGSVSDLDGKFLFTGVNPGFVRLAASSVGFQEYISEDFMVTNAKKVYIEIPMQEKKVELAEVVIKASPYRKTEESPVSLRRIGIAEIEKSPGGNRDISKVIQSFPGVSSTVSYRNDVVVRGGGPAENRFYLDGVEIPNLNHFATQGASGGPVGIINVDFIREVNFYSGAFPADRGNTLSSVLDFKQVDGNKDRLKFRGTIGASDLALTLDGPVSDNTSFIFSARRSYLQFLFSLLELPFLPTYNDFQFKTRTKLSDKSEIIVLGLGAIDQFELNLKASDTPDQKYILSYLPVNEQWNYTIGTVYKRYFDKGYNTWVLSRNYLNNRSYKYENNLEELGKTFDYSSFESENKFRFEHNSTRGDGIKINAGVNFEYARYQNSTNSLLVISDSVVNLDYKTNLDMFNYGLFGQISKTVLQNRLALSLGLRMDGSSYSSEMSNPLSQFSPRLSASYKVSEIFYLNFNTGRYYQRPPYTALGYKDNSGELVNRENGLKYIAADHIVGGMEFRPDEKSQITLEGFYKSYSDYPFSVKDSIPLASKGGGYGVYGDEELLPVSEGRAFGVELLGRSTDILGFNIILSYTFVRSEFKDLRSGSDYLPTAWDNRHILNITSTRSFKKNWDFGFRWRYVGGAPYTPYDYEISSRKNFWDAQGGAYLDYSQYNRVRLNAFHQLDIRIDKQYFFKKWSLMLYLDVQNVYNFNADEPDPLVRRSFIDPDYNDTYTDGSGIDRYELEYLKPSSGGTILPTVGIIVEF
ncbi:MAG: TonB-dependent receptor [Bacteroidales bacterium]|nr:TonB-dependent receptor [Bacteroidales bacterium]